MSVSPMTRYLRGTPITVDYLPASSYKGGDVIVIGNIPMIADCDNPPNAQDSVRQGSLRVALDEVVCQADAAYANGTWVFWNTTNQQVTTTEVAGVTYPFGMIVAGSTNLASDSGSTGAAAYCTVFHYPFNASSFGRTAQESIGTLTTVGAGTITGALLIDGIVQRSGPTSAFTDTTDTAANIWAAQDNPVAGQAIQITIQNTTAFVDTLAAGTGVTLAGITKVPGNSSLRALLVLTSATAATLTGVFVSPLALPPLEVATALTTVGAGTITGAGIAGGVTLRTGPTSAFTDTTDTLANIVAALPNANVGQSFEYTYINQTQYVATLAGGTNVTITLNSAQLLVPGNSFVRFLVTYVSATSVTMVQIGGGFTAVLPAAQFKTMNATTGTLAANAASGAAFCALNSSNATPGSQAMRTPAQILADSPGLVVGQSYMLLINNTGGSGTFTLATDSGSGFTMTGTMTIANAASRLFVVTLNSGTTGTVQSVSIGTIA